MQSSLPFHGCITTNVVFSPVKSALQMVLFSEQIQSPLLEERPIVHTYPPSHRTPSRKPSTQWISRSLEPSTRELCRHTGLGQLPLSSNPQALGSSYPQLTRWGRPPRPWGVQDTLHKSEDLHPPQQTAHPHASFLCFPASTGTYCEIHV